MWTALNEEELTGDNIISSLCFFQIKAVKRLMKEAAELRDPTEHYHAQPLEVSSPQDTTMLLYFLYL